MSDKFTDNTESLRLAMSLHGIADITDPVTWDGLLYSFVKSFLGGIQKRLHFFGNLSHTERVTRISVETFQFYSTINRDYVSVFQRLVIWYAMHDNIINRSANRRWEFRPVRIGKSFERRFCTMVADESLCKAIQLARCTARSDMLCQLGQRPADQEVGITHQLYFVVCF